MTKYEYSDTEAGRNMFAKKDGNAKKNSKSMIRQLFGVCTVLTFGLGIIGIHARLLEWKVKQHDENMLTIRTDSVSGQPVLIQYPDTDSQAVFKLTPMPGE